MVVAAEIREKLIGLLLLLAVTQAQSFVPTVIRL
jgi:hypothetical protein